MLITKYEIAPKDERVYLKYVFENGDYAVAQQGSKVVNYYDYNNVNYASATCPLNINTIEQLVEACHDDSIHK